MKQLLFLLLGFANIIMACIFGVEIIDYYKLICDCNNTSIISNNVNKEFVIWVLYVLFQISGIYFVGKSAEENNK